MLPGDGLLADPAVRLGFDAPGQVLELGGRELGPVDERAADPAGDRLHDQLRQVREDVLSAGRVAAPPGRDRLHPQRLAEQQLGQLGQERQQARVLQDAAAERVDDRDRAEPRGLDQTRHAELGVRAQVERVAEPAVDAAQDHVHRLEPAERALPDPAVGHDEVGAANERVAQQGRQERLLESGLALGARGEQDDPGGLRGRRGDLLEAETHGVEERAEPVDLGLAVQHRQDAGDDAAVRHRVPGTRGRLDAVADHAPRPVRAAGQVRPAQEELAGAQRRDLVPRPQEPRVGVHDLHRQQARPDGLTRAVQVGEQPVEQQGPLGERLLDDRPLALVHEDGERVEAPGLLVRAAERAVGDAVLGEQSVGVGRNLRQTLGAQRLGGGAQLTPAPADPAVEAHHLVPPGAPDPGGAAARGVRVDQP